MVLASHVIFSAYGFWLPNDPRGSWSTWVRQWELFLAGGKATKTNVRHSVARTRHDRETRLKAKSALRFTPVHFSGRQALAIAAGFADAINESGYVVYACSILPRHVHAVIERHTTSFERIVGHLKTRATQRLVAAGFHPFVAHRRAGGRFPSVWADQAWKVFLDSRADVERAVRYVEENPLKEGKRRQSWSFVTECPYL